MDIMYSLPLDIWTITTSFVELDVSYILPAIALFLVASSTWSYWLSVPVPKPKHNASPSSVRINTPAALILTLVLTVVILVPCLGYRSVESLEVSASRGPVNDYRVQCAAVAYIVRKVGLFEDVVLERMLRKCQKKLEIINVTTSALRHWYRHYQLYGNVPAVERRQRSRRDRLKKNSSKRMPRSNHWPPILIEKLKSIVDQHPEYYLDEISEEFQRRTGISKSDSAIYKMLKRHPINYSLKKVTMIAAQRDEEERMEYAKAIRQNVYRPEMVVFIDETAKDPKDDKRRRIWCCGRYHPRNHLG